MTPIGKLTLAVIGLRLFGIAGLLWGMLLGHILIDRSLVKKIIKAQLNHLDDNIRLMLPYHLYRIYNQVINHGLGKLWGALLGFFTYGWNGLIVFCLLGHYLFDNHHNTKGRDFRYALEDFWNRHLAKLTGGILGFSTHYQSCIFIGIIIGFFIDEYRLEGGFRRLFRTKFWSKLNIIKIALRSHTAKDVSFIQSMAGLSAKIAKADGVVSEQEIQVFKKIFNTERNPQVARIFNEAKKTTSGFETYAKQLKILSQNNLDMKENIIENLFKIGITDGEISDTEMQLFDDIANIIEIPQGNYMFIKNRFIIPPQEIANKNDYEVLTLPYTASVKEIKKRWLELINQYHPDRIQAAGGNADEIELATQKMAEINSAYEHLMQRKKAG